MCSVAGCTPAPARWWTPAGPWSWTSWRSPRRKAEAVVEGVAAAKEVEQAPVEEKELMTKAVGVDKEDSSGNSASHRVQVSGNSPTSSHRVRVSGDSPTSSRHREASGDRRLNNSRLDPRRSPVSATGADNEGIVERSAERPWCLRGSRPPAQNP